MRAGKTLPVCKYISDWVKEFPNDPVLVVCPSDITDVWIAQLDELEVDREKYSIIGQGMLSHREPEEFREEFDNPYKLIVVDEIHGYREFSQRYKNLKYLSKNSCKRIGLTATPFDKNLQEMFYPIQWLDKGELLGTEQKSVP